MIRRTADKLGAKCGMEVFPESGNELSTPIRNDGFRNAMQAYNTVHIELSILFCHKNYLHRKEMRGIGETVYNNPDGIIPF